MPRRFRIRTLLLAISAFALLICLATSLAPLHFETMGVAGGIEPFPGYLDAVAEHMETKGYSAAPIPFCILCVEGKWKWYRSPRFSSVIVGVNSEPDNCFIELWYEQPYWFLPNDLAPRGRALNVASDLESILRELHKKDDAESSQQEARTFFIGSFSK